MKTAISLFALLLIIVIAMFLFYHFFVVQKFVSPWEPRHERRYIHDVFPKKHHNLF